MIKENLSTFKIHKLTQAQYDREREAGNLDATALYLTPYEEGVDHTHTSTDAIRLIPDDISDVSEYLGANGEYISFLELTELNDFVESIASGMDDNTQKTYGVVCDFDPFYEYGVLTVSSGYNADGQISCFAKVECGDATGYRTMSDLLWENEWHFNYHSCSVAEEYTYDNWRVRKWSNGECELWASVEASANLSSWGSVVYAENAIASQAYPVTFATVPQVQATPQMVNEYVYGLLSGTVSGTTTTSPSFCVWRANAASASIPVCVDLYIKGTLA